MKRKTALLVLFAFLLSAAAFAADPVEGFWKSIDEKTGEVTAYWKIYVQNGALFGVIVSVPNQDDATLADDCKPSYKDFPVAGPVNKMTVINTPWIYNLTRKAEGVWTGGNIIDPSNGSLYSCKITFRAQDGKKYTVDTLEMRGEVGLGIGRSQYWVRANESDFRK